MAAEIIPFPRRLNTCSDCEWAAFSAHGTFCLQLHEDIWDERWAEECELFDPVGSPIINKE